MDWTRAICQRYEVFLTLKMGRFFGSGSCETSEAVGEIRILTNSATQNVSQRWLSSLEEMQNSLQHTTCRVLRRMIQPTRPSGAAVDFPDLRDDRISCVAYNYRIIARVKCGKVVT